MNANLQIILFGVLGFFILLNFFWLIRMHVRLQRFFMGKKAKDLEDTIEILENNITKLKLAKDKTEAELELINQKLRKSIRGLETIRFNPFPDQGSNQSFAISFLNEDDDGVVISSLYSRDRMSVFAKPIKRGASLHELTEEEQAVLNKAKVKSNQEKENGEE